MAARPRPNRVSPVESWEIVKLIRQAVSLPLVAAFVCVNVQSIELHVHEPSDGLAGHQHGPALHHHGIATTAPSDTPHLTAIDPADTVVPVRLGAASAGTVKPAAARSRAFVSLEPSETSLVSGARIVARAHGPPTTPVPSLRAPPISASL